MFLSSFGVVVGSKARETSRKRASRLGQTQRDASLSWWPMTRKQKKIILGDMKWRASRIMTECTKPLALSGRLFCSGIWNLADDKQEHGSILHLHKPFCDSNCHFSCRKNQTWKKRFFKPVNIYFCLATGNCFQANVFSVGLTTFALG